MQSKANKTIASFYFHYLKDTSRNSAFRISIIEIQLESSVIGNSVVSLKYHAVLCRSNHHCYNELDKN